MTSLLRRACLLLPIPLFTAWIGLKFLAARGPYWLGTNFDPAYAYLLNSLRLAQFHAPALVEHPGTTVEWIGAIVIRVAHATISTSVPLESHVLSRPELYIRSVVGLFVFLYATALVVAGNAVLGRERGSNPTSAWVVQMTPFLSSCLFVDLTDFKPEPVLCALAALFMACVAATLDDPAPRQMRLALAFGIVIGASVATKFTAVSLAAAPLILLRGLRPKLACAAIAAAAFLLLTAPASPGWGRTLAFAWQIAKGHGLYGHGAFAELTPYWPRLGEVLRQEALFFVIVLASLTVAAITALRERRLGPDPTRRADQRALASLLAVQAVQVCLLLKHPYAPRYLFPGMALLGLNLVLAARLVGRSSSGRRRLGLVAGAVACVAAFGIFEAPRLTSQLWVTSQGASCQRQAWLVAHSRPGCVPVGYYRSSSPEIALRFGDDLSMGSFKSGILALHPDALFAEDYLIDTYPKLMRNGGSIATAACYVFQGSPGGPSHPFSPLDAFEPSDLPVPGRVKVVYSSPWEAVFRVRRGAAAEPGDLDARAAPP